MSMMSKAWLRKCGSEKLNTLCFGDREGESVYEIELERISNRQEWEHWEYHMSCKNWFTPLFCQLMLRSANEFHGYDVRSVEKEAVAK